MKIDGFLTEPRLDTIASAAAAYENHGYDGLFLGETKSDPFLALPQAIASTSRLTLGTGIAVALPRSPMHLASVAYDLHRFSGGRHVLGLGSQVRAHIERRFSATFDQPAKRMAELISAIRAIWACWAEGAPLNFRGDFYTVTLMTPFFHPGPTEVGLPPIYLAAVGDVMMQTAGRCADGVFIHPFATPRYIADKALVALAAGCASAARDTSPVTCAAVFIAAGDSEEDVAAQAAVAREQIAFYASTPTYRPVLELHGWGDLQTELQGLAAARRWSDMAATIDDAVLDEFCVRGSTVEVARGLHQRYSGLVDRLSFYTPSQVDPSRWSALAEEVRRLSGRPEEVVVV